MNKQFIVNNIFSFIIMTGILFLNSYQLYSQDFINAKIFDKKGEHTRAAVSVNSLPLGVAVEVDAIFELN